MPNDVLIPTVVEDDDDTCDVKPNLIVKLPRKSRNTGDVIVIDSESEHSDDEMPSTSEIRCENGETPAQTTQKTKGSRDKESTSKKPKEKSKVGKDSEANTSSTDVPPEPTKSTRSVRTQTLLPDNPGNAVVQLNTLRRNVAKLLRVILPDMAVFANIALENVDNALIEVLRVNDVTSNDQPGPSEQTTTIKNSPTLKDNSEAATKTSSSEKKKKS